MWEVGVWEEVSEQERGYYRMVRGSIGLQTRSIRPDRCHRTEHGISFRRQLGLRSFVLLHLRVHPHQLLRFCIVLKVVLSQDPDHRRLQPCLSQHPIWFV